MTFRQRRTVHAGAIGHQSCICIGLFPEVTEGTLLKIVDETVGGACCGTGEKDKNNDGKTNLVNKFLPFHHFKLRFDHVL
jgi:hypothetical protein